MVWMGQDLYLEPDLHGMEKKKEKENQEMQPPGDILPKLALWMFPVSQNPIMQVRI